jgi:hypothetical protein
MPAASRNLLLRSGSLIALATLVGTAAHIASYVR